MHGDDLRGVLCLNGDGEVTEVDEGCARALGHSQRSLVGRALREVIGADAAARLAMAMQVPSALVFTEEGDAVSVCFTSVLREGSGARVTLARRWQAGVGAEMGVAPWVFGTMVSDAMHAAIGKITATSSTLEMAMLRDTPEARGAALALAMGTLGRAKVMLDDLNEAVKTDGFGPGECALDAMIASAAERAKEVHPKAKIEWRPPRVAVGVRGDAAALGEALDALVANAVEADEHRRGVELWCEVDDRRRLARVNVRDRGAGMSPEVAGNAFRAFRSSRGRVGMGLTRARFLASLYGAAVSLASAEGEGCTATLTLVCV